MVLSIPEIPEHILSVFSIDFGGEDVLEAQLSDQILRVRVCLLIEGVVFHRLILLILSVLQLESILRIRQHIPRNGQAFFNGVASVERQRLTNIHNIQLCIDIPIVIPLLVLLYLPYLPTFPVN